VFRSFGAIGLFGTALVVAANALAAQGCGAGLHRNAHGHCVGNRAAVVVAPAAGMAVAPAAVAPVGVGVPAAAAVVAKRCPVHFHMNRNGVCRPN
jgi:hypothetical protein